MAQSPDSAERRAGSESQESKRVSSSHGRHEVSDANRKGRLLKRNTQSAYIYYTARISLHFPYLNQLLAKYPHGGNIWHLSINSGLPCLILINLNEERSKLSGTCVWSGFPRSGIVSPKCSPRSGDVLRCSSNIVSDCDFITQTPGFLI